MNLTQILIALTLGFIGWDVLTTYYGSLTLFVDDASKRKVFEVLASATGAQHILSIVFALIIAVFVLSHKVILAKNVMLAKIILYVAFAYDLFTSFIGTLIVSGAKNAGAISVVGLLACLATFSPVILSMLVESQEDEE